MVALATLIFLLPAAWLVVTAYKPPTAIFASPPALFFTPTLDNFRTIGRLYDIPSLLRSSLTISVG